MTWFGWLTKGHYEISFVDRLACLGEILSIIAAVFIIYGIYWQVKQWFKKRRREITIK